MHLLDGIVIVSYMLVLVGIGLRVSRRQKTTDQYFLAERSIPGWAIGMSLLATIITSVTFIAYPGAAYAGNWALLVPGIMFVVVILSIGKIIVPFFRHVVAMSVYEYFGQRFGSVVRMYSSFAFAMGHFSKMGFVFYLLALSVNGITGWSLSRVIVVLGLITIFYTLIGGLEAVIWTDVVQGFVLWTGVAVSIGLLLFSPKVHAGAVLHLIAVNHKMSLGSMRFDLHAQTFWTMSVYGLFFYLQKYTADQTVVQRYLAASTDRAALRGIGVGAALCLPVWTAFMLIGSLLWAFYRTSGEHLPSSIVKPDQIFPHFMITEMPAGVAGLFLAALFGAAMSMLASDLNCLAVIIVEDFYGKLVPSRTDRQRLRVGKVSVAVCGLLAIAVAMRLSNSQGSALALYYLVTAVVAGGLAGLFLLAFLVRRAGRAAALSGIAVNLIFTTWATLTMNGGRSWNLHRWNYTWHEYTIGAVGNILLFGVGYVVSLCLPVVDAAGPTLWDWLATRRAPHLVTTTEIAGQSMETGVEAREASGSEGMNRLRKAVELNGGKTILGAALYFYDPIFLEVAAHLGYQAIWIEMEHAAITFAEAADLCRMAAGTGMLTMIRIPDSRRENVLKAAECAPDIIDVPMVNTAAQMDEIRQYARFAPEGGRGYFSVSRAVRYGVLNSVNETQQAVNRELCLMAQVETTSALDQLDTLAAAPEVDLFVGPADLAASLGYPAETSHPLVREACTKIVKAARANGKLVASACAPSDFKFWLEQKIDLLFCTNDIVCLKRGAAMALDEARAALAECNPR